MKFLIVDDSEAFVKVNVDELRQKGVDALGLIPHIGAYGMSISQTNAVKGADVIFLDHNMPGGNGDIWMADWQTRVDLTGKRIIGISTDPQPYLTEQIAPSAIEAKISEILAESGS